MCSTFIYTALPCEAKPLIDHYKLKKDLSSSVFTRYDRDDLHLTVTGLGKNAMAAAVAYSQALFAGNGVRILLNIGIAGHKNYPLGQLVLVDKIHDVDTGKNYYPPITFKTKIGTAPLHTVSKATQDYPDICLYDMEASAFYETATRFSSGELVHSLKIVSDNQTSSIANIQAQQVSELIAPHIADIEQLIAALQKQAHLLVTPEPAFFLELSQHYHFTASERTHLKAQLLRWQNLTDNAPLEDTVIKLRNGKEVLHKLNQILNNIEYSL